METEMKMKWKKEMKSGAVLYVVYLYKSATLPLFFFSELMHKQWYFLGKVYVEVRVSS